MEVAPTPASARGVFRSDEGGVTWSAVNSGLVNQHTQAPASWHRVEFAVYNTAGQNLVFTAIVGFDDRLAGVFRSDNQGDPYPGGQASWRVMGDSGFDDDNPPDVNAGSPPQGNLNLSLAVNPNNPDDVYVAGDATGSEHISTVNQWDGDWDQITGLNDGPHPDSRDMAFDANGHLLESDDGGIYRRPGDRWMSVNGDLRCTEIVSVAYDGLNDRLIAGTQDNARAEEGNPGAVSPQLLAWQTWGSGDGGSVGTGPIITDLGAETVRYGIGNNLQ